MIYGGGRDTLVDNLLGVIQGILCPSMHLELVEIIGYRGVAVTLSRQRHGFGSRWDYQFRMNDIKDLGVKKTPFFVPLLSPGIPILHDIL